MIKWNPQGDYPEIDKTAYIDHSAVIIGKVTIGKNVFVAPGAVVRADEQDSSIAIGDSCNIQDKVIIHTLGNSSVLIGDNTSLSHGCIVHGPCRIGKQCFIGFGSVIFKAGLDDGVFVKFMAVVSGVDILSGRVVPDGAVIDTSEKAESLASVTEDLRKFSQNVLEANLELVKGYRLKIYKKEA